MGNALITREGAVRRARRGRPQWDGSRETLVAELQEHLEEQLESVARLLELVVEQGGAIRSREVHEVVRLAGLLGGEMTRRAQIEQRRAALLVRCGELLGVPAQSVTLTGLCSLIDPESRTLAQERSAKLRGMLAQLEREHACNRALMHVELSFLDELMRSLALDGVHAYDATGTQPAGDRARPHSAIRVLDLEA